MPAKAFLLIHEVSVTMFLQNKLSLRVPRASRPGIIGQSFLLNIKMM